MSHLRIRTERLEVIAATEALARAEIHDRAEFARLLGAHIPAWPPPLNDDASMRWGWSYLKENPDANGFAMWYVLLAVENGGEREVIGNGGFKGKPSPDGTVEIGYSLFEAHQGRGYGTEVVRALVRWVFRDTRVTRIIAETLPELKPSRRVLEKNGFAFCGEGSEPGVIRYELTRAAWGRSSVQ
jgi:RimJ/RimL family protein N-acetyltransferase